MINKSLLAILLCQFLASLSSVAQEGENIFLLNLLPLDLSCQCDDKFGAKPPPLKYLIAEKEQNEFYKFSFINAEMQTVDSIFLKYDMESASVVSLEQNDRHQVFIMDSSRVGIEHKYSGKTNSIGRTIVLLAVTNNKSIGKIWKYSTQLVGGSSISKFYYEFHVSIKYGILGFGYYDGRNKFFCEIDLIRDLWER